MKTRKLLIAMIFAFAGLTGFVSSDSCIFYYPTGEGTITETTYYNAKGKPTGTKMYIEVKEVSDSSGYTVEKIHSWYTEEGSDTAVSTVDYDVMCKDGKFLINMTSYLNKEKLAAYEGMDIKMDSKNMTLPANLSAGQKLDDGYVTATVSNEGFTVMTIKVDIKNRKVDALEKITTPAGTFDAVKVSYDIETKMGFTFKAKGVEWYVKDIGVVRSESLNKKGKLQSYREITKITK